MAKKTYYIINVRTRYGSDWRVVSKKPPYYGEPEYFEYGDYMPFTIRANSITEAREIWKKIELGSFDWIKIAEKIAPNGDHILLADALQGNFLRKGVVFELLLRGEDIDRKTAYAVVVAYLRHEETSYDKGPKGDDWRPLYNEGLHEFAREIMGIVK